MDRIDRLIAASPNWLAFWNTLTGGNPQGIASGEAFERLTQLYLLSHPEYRTKLKHVWRVPEEVPPRLRARLNLPTTDEGIDLLAETHDAKFWAIQCKFRSDSTKPLTYGDLSTFTALAFVTCQDIALAVVAHTCSKPVRKHKFLGNTTEIGLDRWLGLTDEDWGAIQAQVKGELVALTPRMPKRHQQDAIQAAQTHFSVASRGRMIMPCGTGKSLTAFWIAQALDAKSIVVAVPSLALIRQSLLDWTREYLAHGEVPQWLVVCSDESAAKLDRDEFVGETYDLGIPTTTKSADIVPFLRKRSGRRIVFTTYQSSDTLARAAREAGIKFDLAIMDEAHKTVGAKAKSFATLLSDENIEVRNRLFMTATERVLRGENDDVFSMDDETVYGRRFHQLTFKEAIAQGIISDYKILTITVNDAAIRELVAANRLIDIEGVETDSQALAAGIALRRAYQEHGITHAISFHRSIKAASVFSDRQSALDESVVPRVTSLHVSSKKATGERAELMRQFVVEERALMTNARCLTEGVDVPAIDCVLFADPKQSVVDIVQAAGRALRPHPGKKYGYILLPLVVPHGMDVDAFAETTEFKQIARTITALSTQDERIAEQFRVVEHGRKPTGKIVEFEGDVPVGLKLDFSLFAMQIGTRIWERVGKANWTPFPEARAFARSLTLKSEQGWRVFAKSGRLPSDIPATPSRVYRNDGWEGLGDWLGTGTIAPRLREYRPFAEARDYARGLKLKSKAEWETFSKSGLLPPDIPATPIQTYASKGWAGIGDWLGTGAVASHLREYRPFTQARTFARSLCLKSGDDWRAFCASGKLPSDIPSNPHNSYRNDGWMGMGDWLGTGTVAPRLREYRPFTEARAFARGLKLKSSDGWRTFCKSGRLPPDIPATPLRAYAGDGWAGMGDWLGTGNVALHLREYRTFTEARAFARNLKLKSESGWRAFCKSGRLPPDIPATPMRAYAGDGWAGMGDWLGTGNVASYFRKYRPFTDARAFARSLKLESEQGWRAYSKSGDLPPDIPASPSQVYRDDGWLSVGDWLGTGTVADKQRTYRSFPEARTFARNLNLKSRSEWTAFCKSGMRPHDIPATPSQTYADRGWAGMGDWLGYEPRRRDKGTAR